MGSVALVVDRVPYSRELSFEFSLLMTLFAIPFLLLASAIVNVMYRRRNGKDGLWGWVVLEVAVVLGLGAVDLFYLFLCILTGLGAP